MTTEATATTTETPIATLSSAIDEVANTEASIADAERALILKHNEERGADRLNAREAKASKEEEGKEVPAEEKAPAKAKPTAKGTEHTVESLRALATDGELEAVLEALGVDVDGTKIPAKRFAEFRKLEKRTQARIAAREQQVTAREHELQTNVNAVLKQFEGVVAARKAFESGDVVKALELFAGEPLDKLTERAMRQKLASDPKVAQMEAELERMKRKELDDRKAEEQNKQTAQQRIQVQNYLAQMKEAFLADEDPIFAALAEGDPDFPNAVYQIQLQAVNNEGVEISHTDAAKRIIDKVRPSAIVWAKALGLASSSEKTENSSRPTRQVESTERAGKSPSKTVQKKAPTVEVTEEELLRRLTNELRAGDFE